MQNGDIYFKKLRGEKNIQTVIDITEGCHIL